jgi:hypothetical protein
MGKTLVAASAIALLLGACCRSRCPEVGRAASLAAAVPAPTPALVSSELRNGEVFLDALVLRVPDASAGRVLGGGGGSGGRTESLLSAADGAALRERATREAGVTVVAMPKILAMPGQEATVFAGEAYAAEGLTQDLPGSEGADAPNWAGHRFRTVATPSADGSTLGLELSFALRDLPPKGAPVDFARLKASEVRGDARVRDMRSGDYFLVVAPMTGAAPDRIVVLLSAMFAKAGPNPRMTVSFKDTPLSKALQKIAEKSNIGLVVSPDVANVPVSGDFVDQDLHTILTKLGEGRFVWALADYGMVRITPAVAK